MHILLLVPSLFHMDLLFFLHTCFFLCAHPFSHPWAPSFSHKISFLLEPFLTFFLSCTYSHMLPLKSSPFLSVLPLIFSPSPPSLILALFPTSSLLSCCILLMYPFPPTTTLSFRCSLFYLFSAFLALSYSLFHMSSLLCFHLFINTLFTKVVYYSLLRAK